VKVSELITLIEKDGWVQVRMKGSHRIPSSDETRHGHGAGKPGVDIPPGTLNSALKQAGLKK
jgi:predicted RNA binding protein YcfA (HicA-like mRNA interferase family)